jgi:hypothetical protein
MLVGYYLGLSVFSVGFCVWIELFLLFMSGVEPKISFLTLTNSLIIESSGKRVNKFHGTGKYKWKNGDWYEGSIKII